jgi:WD40 repeat protein
MLAALLALVFFYGCSKGPGEAEPNTNFPTEITTIYGEVVDEAGVRMPGVTVTAGTSTATTDSRGIFILKNATVRKGRASLLAKKSGYFTSARATETGKNGTTQVKLHMMANTANYNVSANAGGTVNVAGGASIVFEAGSFLKSDGSSYVGNVKVAARYLNPDNANFYDNFSGDNLAQTADGKEIALISCGVLRVEMQGASGETLKLASGKEATLNYPVPTSQVTAPASMPLWYFDEALGMWKEEGSATLTAGKYVGKVSHFTDWNLDYGGETGEVEMRIVCNGIPIQGVAVKVSGFTHKTGYSDVEGKLGFVRVPADKEIEIYINSSDNDGLYFINSPVKVTLTPGQRTNLGDIVLNSPCPAAIEGTLIGCDDKPTEGLIAVSFGTEIKYIYTKDGKFTLMAPSATTLAVNAMDVNGNASLQTDVLPLAEGEIKNVGDVKVCGPNTVSYRDIVLPSKEGGSMVLSPDGTLLAVMEYGGALTIYETATGNTLQTTTVAGLTRGYGSIQFSDDNKKLMICSPYDKTVILDISGASPVELSTITNLYQAIMYSDGSKLIATTKLSGVNTVALFSTTDGSLINTIAVPNMSDSIGRFGLREAENTLLYFDSKTQGSFHAFDIAGTADIWSLTLTGSIWNTFFSANGEVIATTTDYKNYTCYDTKTGAKLADINGGSQNSGISGGGIALTSKFAYSVGLLDGHTTSLINITSYSGALILPKILPDAKYINSISVSKGDEYLAAMYYGGIRIWKLK